MLTLAVAGMAGWVGYRNEVAAVTAAGKAPLTFRSAARHLIAPKSERDALKHLDALRQRAGRGELRPSEAAECWQIIRNLSVAQVKAYLAELPPSRWRSGNETLTLMLHQRWCQLDLVGAERVMLRKKDDPQKDWTIIHAVMTTHIAGDPQEAIRWLEANGTPEMKMIGQRMIGHRLVRQDPATALAIAASLGDPVLGGALNEMSRLMAGTAESRQAFYALKEQYGDAKEWDQALSSMGFEAATVDAEGLLASLKDSGLPPEQAAKMRDRAISAIMTWEPEKAMELMMDPGSGVTQENELSVFRRLVDNHSKKATEWAVRKGRQDLIADSVRASGIGLVRNGSLMWRQRPVGGWSGDVVDRYDVWRAHDRAAAEAWAATMPADVRMQLNGKDADATK